MNSHYLESREYIRPEEKIYQFALSDEEEISWKSFLYTLINEEGLDPWNIDVGVLTKKYLESLKKLKKVDFDISGKLLTIAVFLLKTKAENLVEKDLRGFDEEIAKTQENDDFEEEIESLGDFDDEIDEFTRKKQNGELEIKFRNPFERKRKVSIFDLISVLETTLEQSNIRRANFLQRKASKYDGPLYEKKPKDLKEVIEDLYDMILKELGDKKGHVVFSSLTKGIEHKMGILEKFLPLLYLHNQSRIELKQDKHFSDIEIHKINKGEDFKDK